MEKVSQRISCCVWTAQEVRAWHRHEIILFYVYSLSYEPKTKAKRKTFSKYFEFKYVLSFPELFSFT